MRKIPKAFLQHIETSSDSYPKYRRKSPDDGGQTSVLESVRDGTRVAKEVDDKWIIPYNPWLLRHMNCHLNLEICSSVKSIKYVLKYVHKGSDQATFQVTNPLSREVLKC